MNLSHELVADSDLKLFGSHLEQRTEVHAAGGAYDRIDLADPCEEVANALEIGDVDGVFATRSSRSDDLVPLLEFVGDCAAHRAFGTDNENFHTQPNRRRQPEVAKRF
jgi:hypothetical protein